MCRQDPVKMKSKASTPSVDTIRTTPILSKGKLDKEDQWLEKFDINAFATEIRTLGKELEQQQGEADVKHLNKMVLWSNICAALGLLTMGFGTNLIAIVGLSTWTFTRWTMIAHHTCHGGYDKCHPNKDRWSRFKFAIGSLWRRCNDWLDWMLPEAWNVEHNNRHHYNLSELDDPDLVERNLAEIRDANIPLALKYVIVFIAAATWKWYYYSPNTYKELKLALLRKQGKPLPKGIDPEDAVSIKSIVLGINPFYSAWEFLAVVIGPYMVIRFLLLPLFMASIVGFGTTELLGITSLSFEQVFYSSLYNMLWAELLTNLHGFVAIVPNHAGDDMYRFRNSCRPFSGSFYLRQVLASANFDRGTDIIDIMHGYLNYQIEHHLWPNLSMLSYQKAAPLVKEICEKHGVPYVKENVFIRTKKTIDIMTGTSTMRWLPEEYEREFLEQDYIQEKLKKTSN